MSAHLLTGEDKKVQQGLQFWNAVQDKIDQGKATKETLQSILCSNLITALAQVRMSLKTGQIDDKGWIWLVANACLDVGSEANAVFTAGAASGPAGSLPALHRPDPDISGPNAG